MIKPRKKFMDVAIREAKAARKRGDYAVGAVLTQDGKILAVASNRSKRDESPIAHAETLAILKGAKKMKHRHLPECVLYTTHEPCPMCASVIVWAKLKGVVYGARISDMDKYRQRNGNQNYLWRTIKIPFREVVDKSDEKIEIIPDFMRKDCVNLFHS
jgi:tRNA(Arg) A34 adenosine deaminase TadA